MLKYAANVAAYGPIFVFFAIEVYASGGGGT
jgi:hypothetical protein